MLGASTYLNAASADGHCCIPCLMLPRGDVKRDAFNTAWQQRRTSLQVSVLLRLTANTLMETAAL